MAGDREGAFIAPERTDGRYRSGDVIPSPEMLRKAREVEARYGVGSEGDFEVAGWPAGDPGAGVEKNEGVVKLVDGTRALIGERTGFKFVPCAETSNVPRFVGVGDEERSVMELDLVPVDGDRNALEEQVVALADKYGSDLGGLSIERLGYALSLPPIDQELWGAVSSLDDEMPDEMLREGLWKLVIRRVASQRQTGLMQGVNASLHRSFCRRRLTGKPSDDQRVCFTVDSEGSFEMDGFLCRTVEGFDIGGSLTHGLDQGQFSHASVRNLWRDRACRQATLFFAEFLGQVRFAFADNIDALGNYGGVLVARTLVSGEAFDFDVGLVADSRDTYHFTATPNLVYGVVSENCKSCIGGLAHLR